MKLARKRELVRLRNIALALPEVNERMSHGAPCFFIRNKLPLCYFHDNHRGDGRISLWCPAARDVQGTMVRVDSQRFFCPSTSHAGHFRNWLGVFLDINDEVDWDEVAFILERAYRAIAPKALVAKLDGRMPDRASAPRR